MQVFSLLAQTLADVQSFIAAANRKGARLQNVDIHTERSGVELEFVSPVEREQLDDILSGTLEKAMMRRTLRAVPREENPMTFGPTIAVVG
jgi:hypothetical protein